MSFYKISLWKSMRPGVRSSLDIKQSPQIPQHASASSQPENHTVQVQNAALGYAQRDAHFARSMLVQRRSAEVARRQLLRISDSALRTKS